ncbi:hypothetical protein L2E82_35951 [Cichorium intybus]|uniref:Uncharacterized protein n=1 Tax=Cichorium intybus TaxID=13427 RepID=A0ACB9BQ66_CICIN|nr:hypothetical protein L2E82_35951 [Cichorium intybus]
MTHDEISQVHGYGQFHNTPRPFRNNQQKEVTQPQVRQHHVQPVPLARNLNIGTQEIFEMLLKLKEVEDTNTQAMLKLGEMLLKLVKDRAQEKTQPSKVQVNEVITLRSGKKVDNKVATPPVEEDSDVEVVFDEKEELEKEEKREKEGDMWDLYGKKGETSRTAPFPTALEKPEKRLYGKKGPISLPENVSSIIMDALLPKMKDLVVPLISTDLGDVYIKKALLDLGASVNILPGQLFDKYEFGTMRPTDVIL